MLVYLRVNPTLLHAKVSTTPFDHAVSTYDIGDTVFTLLDETGALCHGKLHTSGGSYGMTCEIHIYRGRYEFVGEFGYMPLLGTMPNTTIDLVRTEIPLHDMCLPLASSHSSTVDQ
jgi:hypothetical protein